MWILLNLLGVLGSLLLALALYALFKQSRIPEAARKGLTALPRIGWIGIIAVSLVFIFLGLNATAFLPGPDQEAIQEDIDAFDAEFDDL